MRLVCAILAMSCFAAAPAHGASEVTLILEFDQAYSSQSVDAMKHEVNAIIGQSGIHLDWRLREDVRSSESFPDLVVVRFKGTCIMQPVPYLMDERGYYAFTHTSNGDVLPFSEVECDKVRSSIRPVMSGAQWVERDTVLGRALGRVLAHELYHMLAKTQRHGKDGVAKDALSPAQLVSNELKMTQKDLEKLHTSTH